MQNFLKCDQKTILSFIKMEVAVIGLWLTKHNFHLFIRQKLYSLPRNQLVIFSEVVLGKVVLVNILVIFSEP